MESGLDKLIELTKDMQCGRLLYRIGNFEMPTLSALAVEFQKLPRLFGLIVRIDRAAVLADQGWIRKISEIEGSLFPGLEIRAFESHQEKEALDYLHEGIPEN